MSAHGVRIIMQDKEWVGEARPSTPLAPPPVELSPAEYKLRNPISETNGLHGDYTGVRRGAGMSFNRTPEAAREIQVRAARLGGRARKQMRQEGRS